MKKQMHRLLSLMLSLILVVGLIPGTMIAHAATGAGTESDPRYVTNFAELKNAMQNESVTHIVVNEFANLTGLDYYPLQKDVDYVADESAISIPYGKTKHLTVNCKIDVRAMDTTAYLYSLITNNGDLTIDGTGSINASFNAPSYPSAIVLNYNASSKMTVKGNVGLHAHTTTVPGFGYAIYGYLGAVDIQGGVFSSVCAIPNISSSDVTSSVIVKGESTAKISGGTFKAPTVTNGSRVPYGLLVENNKDANNVAISGGTFEGIYIENTDGAGNHTGKLGNQLAVGCNFYLSSNNKLSSTDLSAYSINNTVYVSKEKITQIVVTCAGYALNKNIADAKPVITTEGVEIKSYEWYDNSGNKLTSGTFAADTQYRLEVFLDVKDDYTAEGLEKSSVTVMGKTPSYFDNPLENPSQGDMRIYDYPAMLSDNSGASITITYDANGGTGTMAPSVLTKENRSATLTVPTCGFTAPAGKKFAGWDFGDTWYLQPGAKRTFYVDTTLKAVWEDAVEYNVTVTGGTASVGAGTPITKATMGTTVTLTAGAAPSGQMFDKWVVNGVVVADANSATTTFVMPAGNVTATATYKNIPVVSYTVSFDANGGTGSMADATGISGEYTLPENGFTAPAGKQFKAWSVGGVEKAVGDKITVTANTTVTAVWEAVEYNVTVTGGTASVGAGTPIIKATMGTTVILTAGAAPFGQMFDKWVVTGLDTTGMDLTKTEIKFQMPAGDVTFKATYLTVTKYEIYVVDGTKDKSPAKAGETITITANPAPTGKVFDKWTCETAGVTIEFANATNSKTTFVMPASNIKIQAHFRAVDDKPSVEIKVEGGTGAGTYKQGDEVTVTAEDKEGKEFKGWQDASGKIVSTDKEYTFTVAEATTLTAVYEDKPSGGGEITPPAKKDGLSGGQIAGIVIGSVLLAGIGGFAIFWFAVKKKTFADLGVALKKGFTAIGNFFKTLGGKIKALFTKKK